MERRLIKNPRMIVIDETTKSALDEKKLVGEETYNNCICRLLEEVK